MNRFTIRTKIFLGTVIVSICFITLTLFMTDRLMGRISADQAALNLRIGKRAYSRFVSLRRNLMTAQARSLAQTPHLRAVMSIPEVDHETVWYTARQLFDLADVPWMVLTDASGKLLADAADSTSHGEDLSWQPCVERALEGEKEHVGIWYLAGDLLRIVALPMTLGDQILGTLVIGERLDDAYADEIRGFTGRDAMILHERELVGWSVEDSTATRPSPAEVQQLYSQIVAQTDNGLTPTSTLGGRRSLATIIRLPDTNDRIVLFQHLSELESGVAVVRNSVLVAGAVSVLLAILLSIWVSFRISQPIQHLKQAAELLGSGQLRDRVVVSSQDELGHLASTFNIMADRLHAAYTELEVINRELERRVEERTRSQRREVEDHEKTEAERQKAERELELQRTRSARSDRLRSLGEMAAGIAHELNQPLVGVRGLAEHILIGISKGWDTAEAKLTDRLARIVEEADRMTHIIEHVRLFAREAGKPDVSEVSVNEVVKSSVNMLEAQFRFHGIDLQLSLAEELPLVSVNPFSLEEVFLNLLSNARDAVEVAPEADRTQSVTLSTEVDSADGVRVIVRDNGIGIEEANLDRVCEPFFTTKDPDKGTGLGLSICKSIVEDFGGSLDIASTPGVGTEIQIFLPSRTTAADARQPDTQLATLA